MEIGSSYPSTGIFDLDSIDSSKKSYSRIQDQTTPSGDTVDISDEARKLYSEMIHKYDKTTSGSKSAEDGQDEAGSDSSGGAAGGAGAQGAGSLGESSSGDAVENLKKQIQALKSQLASIASQIGSGKGGTAEMSKMSTLQSQIAALEAELNAMEQAG